MNKEDRLNQIDEAVWVKDARVTLNLHDTPEKGTDAHCRLSLRSPYWNRRHTQLCVGAAGLIVLLFLVGCDIKVETPSERNREAKKTYEDMKHPAKCKRLIKTIAYYIPTNKQEHQYRHKASMPRRYICVDVGLCYLRVWAGRSTYAVPLPANRCKEEGLL